MRVLQTVAEMAVGGAEQVVVNLCRGLTARGDSVALAAAAGDRDRELAGLSVERHMLPYARRSTALAAANAVTLARVVRGFRPDVIHSHNVRATATALVARRARPLHPAPLVATFHGVIPAERGRGAGILAAADHVVCVSEELARHFPPGGNALSIIPNGVVPAAELTPERRAALDRELGLDGRVVVSIVGRLVPVKNHARFLDTVAIVARERPAARFLIVGEGPLRKELEARADALALTDVVRFTGLRRDARDLIARSEVVVVSSDSEGLSIASLEALAAGVPVVSTAVPGMNRLLADGAGTVVGHDAEDLARAVLAVLADDDLRERMGRVGTALIARDFTPDAMIDAYSAIYARLAAR